MKVLRCLATSAQLDLTALAMRVVPYLLNLGSILAAHRTKQMQYAQTRLGAQGLDNITWFLHRWFV